MLMSKIKISICVGFVTSILTANIPSRTKYHFYDVSVIISHFSCGGKKIKKKSSYQQTKHRQRWSSWLFIFTKCWKGNTATISNCKQAILKTMTITQHHGNQKISNIYLSVLSINKKAVKQLLQTDKWFTSVTTSATGLSAVYISILFEWISSLCVISWTVTTHCSSLFSSHPL